jgi:hypothetical protein
MKGYLYTIFEAMHVHYISCCQIIMQFVVYQCITLLESTLYIR